MASSSTWSSDARLDRATGLLRLASDTFDVLVIGGGITGSGVALDAITRGLSTALVERDDFASGTSSKSSKLIHGGLRYLQQGDIRLVYEALRERKRLHRNASHLVHVLPFMIPILSKDSVVSKKLRALLVRRCGCMTSQVAGASESCTSVSKQTKPLLISPQCHANDSRRRICITTPRPTMRDCVSPFCAPPPTMVQFLLTLAR